MTCIVGLIHSGRAWMGGDSATTWDEPRLSVSRNPKVFRVGEFVIGYCGSGRVGRLLQYEFTPPPVTRRMAADKYISTVFVDALRACLRDGGVLLKKDNAEEIPSTLLVAFRGHLWRVDGDFNVDEAEHGFDCVGAGAKVALGALHATSGQTPKRRVLSALRAAQEFDWSVRGPFAVIADDVKEGTMKP